MDPAARRSLAAPGAAQPGAHDDPRPDRWCSCPTRAPRASTRRWCGSRARRLSTPRPTWCGSSPSAPTPDPGQPVLCSRADAIQLVGINAETGHATIIGIPRDSYVDIPGYGSNKINASMVYGGPQLMAQSVANMMGLTPDYVFTTSFWGVQNMIAAVGGVRVYSPYSWSIPVATVPSRHERADRGGGHRLRQDAALASRWRLRPLPRPGLPADGYAAPGAGDHPGARRRWSG